MMTSHQDLSPHQTSTGFSPTPGVILTRLSYRDVLHTRERIGYINHMQELAKQLGYPYFLWNDRVYMTTSDQWLDTGLTVADIL